MNQDWKKNIQDRVKGVPIVSGRSSNLQNDGWEDLLFIPAQLAKKPVDYFHEKIKAETVVGKKSKKPINIQTPVIIGGMSFGALSREAKTALAKAATLAGTIENSGEGGVLPEEREFAERLIIQYSTGRFGINEEVLKKADAIEIKIGQGAKPGQGGFLAQEKVTKEIAEIRGVKLNENIHSPAYHLDIKNIDDLKKKVEWLRELTAGAPIILKIAAGDIENDISLAVKTNPDIIAIDGFRGGTGAAPEIMLEEVGIPALAALVRARKALDKINAPQELWIGGGLNKGGDFAKALALGADAVFIGFPLLIAMGCSYCQLCRFGRCPKGVTTQDPKLRKNLDVEQAAQDVANYIKNCTEEIKMVAGACGKDNIYDLSSDDLTALNLETAKITGVKFVGDN